MCDIIFRHNLIQVVEFPSHSQVNTADLIFTNFHGLIENTTCLFSHSLKSNHLFLSFSICSPVKLAKTKCSPICSLNLTTSISKFDLFYLVHLDYSVLHSSSDIENLWSSLKSILHAFSLFTRLLRTQSYPRWLCSILSLDSI